MYLNFAEDEELGIDLTADEPTGLPPLLARSGGPWPGAAPLVQASPAATPMPGATVAETTAKLPILALAAGALGLLVVFGRK